MAKTQTKRGPNPETQIQKAILDCLNRIPGVAAWRNSTGAMKTAQGRFLRFGLCKGSADIIGIVAPYGRFLAIEVKKPGGKATPEQLEWLARVRELGGIAAVVETVEEAMLCAQAAMVPKKVKRETRRPGSAEGGVERQVH